jgi:preprotein translocase subunit SecB
MSETNDKKQVEAKLKATPVQVIAQYVKDFSFENPNAPDALRQSAARPEMDVSLMIDAAKIKDDTNPDLYESSLALKVKSTRDGEVLFLTEIVYAALVTIKDVPESFIKPILYVEIPQMMFPFARQIIASAVSAGGFPPLLLTPMDFRGMYENSPKQDGSIAA